MGRFSLGANFCRKACVRCPIEGELSERGVRLSPQVIRAHRRVWFLRVLPQRSLAPRRKARGCELHLSSGGEAHEQEEPAPHHARKFRRH